MAELANNNDSWPAMRNPRLRLSLHSGGRLHVLHAGYTLYECDICGPPGVLLGSGVLLREAADTALATRDVRWMRGGRVPMIDSDRRVRAVVQVVMEIEAGSVWSGDTTWSDIARQAEDGVRGLLTGGNVLALKELPRKIKSLRMVEVQVFEEGSR